MGLVAEFLIHTCLDGGIVRTKAAFTFVTIAILAANHSVCQRIDVDGGLGRGFACEFLVDALLDGRIIRPEAAWAVSNFVDG